ncbi:MAG: nucleotidyltransferase domain-containing protein [Actinomycetales bacterium]|nr:nucleotidyltransferase domain-containing protein [Actinomycetales bacterium]
MTEIGAALEGLKLWPHHVETIERTVERIRADGAALALILGGSLAHGLGTEGSDVDIVVLAERGDFARRAAVPDLTFTWHDVPTYDSYVDGKWADLDFLETVAQRGSDPARWAFAGARILFSHEPALAGVLERIGRFPIEEQPARTASLAAQLCAWRWFYSEATAKQNAYLHHTAVHHTILNASRLVHARNAQFFPFHKWMLRTVEAAGDRPADLLDRFDTLLAHPSQERIDTLVEDLFAHYGIDSAETQRTWGTHFMHDTELAWYHGTEL